MKITLLSLRNIGAIIFLLACTSTPILSSGQRNELVNREAFKLKMAVDETDFYQDDVKSAPYILPGNTIQIYPGEKIFVEVELDGTEIKSMKAVKKNLNPGKTITITFSQRTEGRMHKGMMLQIDNPFNYQIIYKAKMYLLKPQRWVSTNVFPVYPKIAGFETWPDIIVTLALSDWSFK